MCCKNQKCERPEKLKETTEKCSEEQVQQCHGNVQRHPCEPADGCEHPEKLKCKPGECSPEQVRECHGEVSEHPCEQSSQKI